MIYHVNGTVNSSNTEYYNCLTFSKLKIRVYSVGYDTLTEIDDIDVDSDGSFSKEIDSAESSILVKLFYLVGDVPPVETFVDQSEVFCFHDPITIDFLIDESKFTSYVVTTIYNRIDEICFTPAVEEIVPLTAEDIKKISCLTCITEKSLLRFQAAYRLYSEFLDFDDTLYTETESGIASFKGDEGKATMILFGLLESNYTISVTDIFSYSETQFIEKLEAASEKNEIDISVSDTGNIDMLLACRNGLLLNAKNNGSYYDAKLIHLSDNTYEDKSDLLDEVLDGGGLSGIISEDPMENSDALLKVIPLMTLDRHLKHFPQMLSYSIGSPSVTDDPDYYELALEGSSLWLGFIAGTGYYPAGYTASEYAQAIYDSIADSVPSARLSRNLDASTITDASTLKGVLDDNRNFNIEEHSVAAYFSTVDTDPNYLAPETMLKMQQLQRSVKISGDREDLDATKVMMENELSSSYAITRKGKAGFGDVMFAEGSIPKEKSDKIYCRAAAMNSTISMLMAQYKRYESKDALMPSALINPEHDVDPLPNLPDLESLFGSLDTCNCSECQSIYSPAAYLTDLLHWLATSVTDTNGSDSGFEALMEQASENRRKDIRYLKLNCRNTNTIVPYIDLVNEILSVNLLIDAPGYTAPDVIDAYETLQTTKTADELLTEPEHRFPAAEELLKENYFQWALPYDAAYDESTSYLKKLNKPYADLIHDFTGEAIWYNNDSWANAFLQLNPSEAYMISSAQDMDPLFWKKFWGLEAADLLDDDTPPDTPAVGAVLKSANLSLKELQDILTAFYINGLDPIEVIPYDEDECDVDKYTFLPKFTEEVADRFMRFLRLKRKTGLSTTELDLAIINHSSSGDIDQAFLIKLASCMAFAKQYNLEFTEVELFYNANGYVDHYTSTTVSEYFRKKFWNPLLPLEVINFFTPGETGQVFTKNVNSLTDADKQKLARIFNVSIPAIEVIMDYALPGNPTVSMSNLAVIERYSIFVRIFGIGADQLDTTIEYFGDPFLATNIVSALWTFSKKYTIFKTLDIRLTDFIDIVEGTGIYASTAPELIAEAELVWLEVEKAYKLAIQAHPEKEFSSGTLLPTAPSDIAFFEDVVLDSLRVPFNLRIRDVADSIIDYSTLWAQTYITDPEGSTTSRTWANKKAAFIPVYRFLKRIRMIADIFGIDQDAITKATDFDVRGGGNIPVSYFYWLMNSFVTADMDKFIWIKNALDYAKTLDVEQSVYLDLCDIYASDNNGFTAVIFSNFGQNSVYKPLSIFEFTQTLLRAQEIATDSTDFTNVMGTFSRIFSTVKTLGYNISDGWNWVWAPMAQIANVADFSADIRRVLKNKYSSFKTWSDVIVPVQNELRARLRDALVAMYIGTRGFKNENAIYAYYLLDTQMAPCNQTSRVVAAISSAQLLVHRALLGIEVDVHMDEDDKNEWEWRKNYRVWEANRKVFLYPENWIDPSLRTNKTTLFKNAEDLLQQDEINQQNSELAFAGYLTGLNDVAHLDIRSTLIEKPAQVTPCCDDNTSDTIHVFARSWNPPYIHYYRNRKSDVWSAWEKIDLEIDSDHLIPVIFNRKLYLFFPMFIEKQHRVIKTNLNGETVNAPYLEIKMCYTKQDFGKWSNKKVLDGTLQAGTVSGINIPNTEAGLVNKLRKKLEVAGNLNSKIIDWKNETNTGLLWKNDTIINYAYTSLKRESFYFWPQVDISTGDLRIHCRRDYHEDVDSYHNGYTHMANEWGFLIGACDEKVKIVPPVVANDILSRPYMTLPYFEQMKYGKDYGAVVTADAGLWVKTTTGHAPLSNKLFRNTNGDYVLTYPQQYLDNLSGQPFFYSDTKHSLFIDSSKKVTLHEHPFTCKMLEALNRFGIDGLLNSKEAGGLQRQAASVGFFPTEYNPTGVSTPYPVMNYDFSSTGAYSIYNWEVFFHTVSLIARQLRQSNKFEDALKWINYIFDPANRDMSLQDLRYWKIKPFLIDVTKGIPYYMRLLSAPNLTAAEKEEKKQWEQQIEMWRDHPFDPHLIASMRPRAYMLWTVMELIEILSDWGDYLFRQDTTESINEAINLYVLASEILGERPKKVDRPAPPEYNFDEIISNLMAFATASAKFEDYMTGLNLCQCRDGLSENGPCINSPALSTLPELGFCIPENPRMAEMWDRVEDRLFKIRNCMNIDGKKRQLALFAPPIDPALLVRATAMGLDLSDVLSDLAAAPPHYRFSYLLQRANDFTNEVKSLGSQLLTALEKKDGEELSVLRQIHEQNILKASRTLKELQLEEAKENYSTLQYSKNLIQIRLDDYKNREYQNSREGNAQRQTQLAEGLMLGEQGVKALAGLLNLIPDVFAGAPTASGATVFGGGKISKLLDAGAGGLSIAATVNRNKASMSLTYAGYDRRQEEWNLQIKSATEELLQVDRQLLSSEIRIAIAEKELENHDLQVAQSAEIYDWLRTKYTNQALYTWMAGQLKTLHRKCYDMAYDLAKQAQQAFYRDLGSDPDLTPKINFGNWDSSRAGFFAGERLSIQLKELETYYMQHNTRDYELSKNISLALLDPYALEQLKGTGTCTITLPEVLFDMDYPNHYYRRIKSIGITIPGIAGPYTTVGATLTLMSSSVRRDAAYPGAGLQIEASSMESIATSSAQNDSGVFELNFKDERYMPFEHKGAVSTWRLEFSDIVRQFDFQSISDVIMHMQYSAKEAGSVFAGDVKANFTTGLAALSPDYANGFYYAINLRHDMPNEWHELKQNGVVNITIAKNRLPYFVQARNPFIDGSAGSTVYALVNSKAGFDNSSFVIGSTGIAPAVSPHNDEYYIGGAAISSGLNLDSPIAFASNLDIGEDFNELILLFKIGVI